MDHWPRREHYQFFRRFGVPFVSITSSVDVAPLRKVLRERETRFSIGLVYVLARAANAVPQFRQRVREAVPIEYEIVHPGLTVLCDGDVFRFSLLRYVEAFAGFAAEATDAIERTRACTSLGDAPGRDDLLYCSALPWISFSGMFHPLPLDPMDSVPRLAWGRFEESKQRLMMPLNIQAHHALIDGIHIAQFIRNVEHLIAMSGEIL